MENMMKNQIAWLEKPQKIVIRDAEIPKPKKNEVLIQAKYVGICGSDVAFFLDPTMHGRFHPEKPFILGHEVSGTIVGKGEDVTDLDLGERVAVEPGEPCGTCEFCRSGRYNLCRKMNFMATSPFERGALCRYFTFPADWVFRLPENVDMLQGAMMEPLAVGMAAAKKGEVTFDKTVVVLGTGCIGLMTILACRACGAVNIIAADVLDSRLENAKEKGALHVVNSAAENVVDAVMKLTDGRGADVVFETAGTKFTTPVTCDLVRPGGRVVLVAQPKEPTPYDFFAMARKEADVTGVFRYANLYPAVLCAAAGGGADPASVVTHTFPFEDVQEAFERSAFDKEHVVKAAVCFEDEL